jgi:hypothetical protein
LQGFSSFALEESAHGGFTDNPSTKHKKIRLKLANAKMNDFSRCARVSDPAHDLTEGLPVPPQRIPTVKATARSETFAEQETLAEQITERIN